MRKYRNLVNFRATNFSILIVHCGYSSRFRFTHEILSPRKKRQTIITYLPGHVNAYRIRCNYSATTIEAPHCKNGLVKLTNHWLPQFHLLFSLFILSRSKKE